MSEPGFPKPNQEKTPEQVVAQSAFELMSAEAQKILVEVRRLRKEVSNLSHYKYSPETEQEQQELLGDASKLMDELFVHNPTEHQLIVNEVIENREEHFLWVGEDNERLHDVDFNETARYLQERGNLDVLAEVLVTSGTFPRKGEVYGDEQKIFDGFDVAYAREFVRLDRLEPVTGHSEYFSGIDRSLVDEIFSHPNIRKKTTAYGKATALSDFLRVSANRIPASLTYAEIAQSAVGHGFSKDILKHATEENLKSLPHDQLRQVVISWLESDELDAEAKMQNDEKLDAKTFVKIVKLNKQYTPPLSEEVAAFTDIAGTAPSLRLFVQYHSGELDDQQLLDLIAKARSVITEGDDAVLAEAFEDQNLFSVIEGYFRIKDSEWSSGSERETQEIIENYLENKEDYTPLAPEYTRGDVRVHKIEKRKTEGTDYSPEFMERWPVIIKAIIDAEEYSSGNKDLKDLVGGFGYTMNGLQIAQQSKIDSLKENPRLDTPEKLARAQEHAGKDFERVSAIPKTLRGMGQAFDTVFDSGNELNNTFLIFGFALAMRKHSWKIDHRDLVNPNPTPETISAVLNFVTHLAHQETWKNRARFADKASRKKLGQIFHAKALEEQFSRMQSDNTVSTETVDIDVRPGRDITTEFAGHAGDACYAGQMDILERDNISSLIFSIDGHVAGSSLLIDAETGQDEQYTIIRALNPLEATINKLDPESFLKGLLGYLEPIASKRDRKIAIVIDDGPGGSCTNRPALFNYLDRLKNAKLLSSRVRGLSNEQTEFNEYDITSDTYEISLDMFD